jgi:hypothetical protein
MNQFQSSSRGAKHRVPHAPVLRVGSGATDLRSQRPLAFSGSEALSGHGFSRAETTHVMYGFSR